MTDYLDKFAALLVQLQPSERDEVLEFYREYLLDADIQTYDDCVAELGSPKQLARKILADYSIRLNEQLNSDSTHRQKSRANVRTIWLVGLALLSTPITIPVLIALLAITFAMIVATIAIGISLLAIFASVALLALGAITAGIGVFTQSLWISLFYIGAGLSILGAELLVLPLVVWFIGLIIQGIATLSQRLYHRLVKRNRAERGGRHHEKNR